METRDKNYLQLQFRNKVYKFNGTEFQSFFENIMETAYPDFKKIRPYGNKGDGGNDGYRPSVGAYYQVYAPRIPNEKETESVNKLKEDFEKLKTNWDKISEVKIYYFVFNDKWGGSTIVLEEALADLKHDNPNIEFLLFTPRSLEEIFFKLNNEDILTLGFDVDSTKAISIVREYLDKIEIDLDRDSGKSAQKALENIKDILFSLEDESLQLEYEILEARILQKLENNNEAIKLFESLCTRYPNNPWAFLYLAEYYLNLEDFDNNEKLLKKAEEIDSENSLLILEKLIRKIRLKNQIDISKIDEKTFPKESRMKSNFYRLYSLVFNNAGDKERAISFIERAIKLNPDRINNYDVKFTILESNIFSEDTNKDEFQEQISNYIAKIVDVEDKAKEYGGLSPRIQSIFNLRKINSLKYLEPTHEIGTLAKNTFELLVQCSFDHMTDGLFVVLLMHTDLSQKSLDILLKYLEQSDKEISDDLSKAIIFQFCLKSALISVGQKYFKSTKKTNIIKFIDNLKSKQFDKAWEFLGKDTRFAIAFANSAKEFPELRKLIIQNLPNDGTIQKDKLLLLINYDEDKLDEAFELLKGYDFSNLHYYECKPILDIAWKKGAWEFVIIVIDKFLEYEKDERHCLQLNLQKFTACQNLGKFNEVIQIGEQILSNENEVDLLDDLNKESVLGQTILAKLKRGEYKEAETLLSKYSDFKFTFEFKIGIETEVFLKNKKAEDALNSIVDGIKLLNSPNPEQYGSLFFVFAVISNLSGFNMDSLEQVNDNCFVKFKDQERWFYIGDQCELDASKISSTDEKYSIYTGKKMNEKLEFKNKYSSKNNEQTIELILPIEKYIAWQCRHHATMLSQENRWDKMKMVEISTAGEKFDPKYLIAFLEDQKKGRGNFFDLYCKENVPFAFLAVNQGGLGGAISTIVNENKGFIKFSSGDITEINKQKEIAKKIINGDQFYLDGTSALVLSEIGLLETIYEYLPNLQVPQSVITMLLDVKERFESTPGQVGHMGYAQGRISFSELDQDKGDQIKKNFDKCIELLESQQEKIKAISNATKSECESEKMVPSELCDACILAQNEKSIILTEDFLYLQVNALQTKKEIPEYCSTYALVRTLYEQNKISFVQYLEYFGYLSSYRFKFLPISTEDIEKAVFGDKKITIVNPKAIRYFNFPLTLSQDYGVPFDKAFQVVGRFFLKILTDDSITIDTAEQIFDEILTAFPTEKSKSTLGKMFLQVSVQIINNKTANVIVGSLTQNKIDILSQFTQIYDGTKIIRP